MKKIIAAISFLTCLVSAARSWQDTVQMIDKIMSRYKDENPGAQMAISRNGQLIYTGVKGMADLEHKVPLAKNSKTEAGSVSKQFTAAAILLLEQQGKLSLNDDIRKYLPEIRNYGSVIRVYHLLHHTSGLKDWGSVISLSGWPRGTRAYSNDDALYIISNQKTLNNKPGDEYIYSNSNYTALTMIVQRVSGMTHAEFTKKYLFEPAGMKNTEWRDNYKRIVVNRAIAYSKSGNHYITNMPNEDTYGHGAILTTTEDLLLWNNFFLNGKLGNPSLLPKQTETRNLNNGDLNVYAAGLVVDSINGWKAIYHTGATASYRAQLEHFPDLGLSFAWLSNTSEPGLSDVPGTVRNIFIKNLSAPEAEKENFDTTVSWKKFIPWLGAYRNWQTGTGLLLYKKENGIYSVTHGGPMPVVNTNTLAAGGSRMIFKSANPRVLQFVNQSGDTIVYKAADTAKTDEQSLKEYTGTYYSDETESKMFIEIRNGKLVLFPRKGTEYELTPVYKNGFDYPGADLWFERNKSGRLTHFYINVSRARKVEFKKIK